MEAPAAGKYYLILKGLGQKLYFISQDNPLTISFKSLDGPTGAIKSLKNLDPTTAIVSIAQVVDGALTRRVQY